MKYYEMHEDAYQQLKQQGYVSWDRNSKATELFEHDINRALDQSLKSYFSNPRGKKVLDLGTGTGTVALFLAHRGFSSSGYDISRTAISMAKKNAAELGLAVNFQVNDINNTKETSLALDLIVDSSFLHCIVLDQDRRSCYQFVKNNLARDGLFFIYTMIESPDMSEMLAADHLLLEKEILWSTGKDSWDMDWREVNGRRVFPHRRILSLASIEEEIVCNGFEVIERSIKQNGKNPLTYSAWVKVHKPVP